MTFPIDFRGEIDWTDVRKDKNLFLTLMPTELRSIGLQRVFVQGDKISFGGGTPQYFSRWNILTAIDSGEIEVISRDDSLIISYHLSFKFSFVLSSVVCFSLLILWAIIGHPPIQVVIAMSLFVFAWLVIAGLHSWMTARKFSSLIKHQLMCISVSASR